MSRAMPGKRRFPPVADLRNFRLSDPNRSFQHLPILWVPAFAGMSGGLDP